MYKIIYVTIIEHNFHEAVKELEAEVETYLKLGYKPCGGVVYVERPLAGALAQALYRWE